LAIRVQKGVRVLAFRSSVQKEVICATLTCESFWFSKEQLSRLHLRSGRADKSDPQTELMLTKLLSEFLPSPRIRKSSNNSAASRGPVARVVNGLSRIYECGFPCRTHLDVSIATRSTAIHIELHTEVAVAACLEDAAQSKGPGYVFAA
jgi:hypothetical protein